MSLHPVHGFDNRSQLYIRALFEGLTRVDAEGTVIPALAQTIVVSEDKRTYTFTLKDSIWTNGEPVLASDFAYAWRKALTYGSGSTLIDLFYHIKNGKAVKEAHVPPESLGVEVVDSKTLRVELDHPIPYFLQLLSNPIFSPICKNIEELSEDWHLAGVGFVCNGPFRIKERNNKELILEKNPLYHDAASVALSEAQIHFVTDPHTTMQMFERCEIDWVGDPFEKLPGDVISHFIETDKLNIVPVAALQWILCNLDTPALRSANIRKALAYAINRQEIVDNVSLGCQATFSIAPKMLSCLDEETKNQDFDLCLAKYYFQKGLEELGVTEEEFPPIEMLYLPSYRDFVQSIQEQVRHHLGIKLKLRCAEVNACFQSFVSKQYEMGTIGWITFFEDPIYHLNALRMRSNLSNLTGWENPDYRELLELADQEIDEGVRREYLKTAEQILLEEMPIIPLYSTAFRYLKNPKVRAPKITTLGEFDLKWVSKSA